MAVSLIEKTKSFYFQRELARLSALMKHLEGVSTWEEKIAILNALPELQNLSYCPLWIQNHIESLSVERKYLVKLIFAIRQGERIFSLPQEENSYLFASLIDQLFEINHFYQDRGGLLGYQCLVLSLLSTQDVSHSASCLYPPPLVDLSQNTPEVKKAMIDGIRAQSSLAEIYPIGGTADRLKLIDQNHRHHLPAACLVFLGKYLLERVIHDLQAREYLYYKLFDKHITTPIVLMTSEVNKNDDYIKDIFEKHQWFGRPRDHFRFCMQPAIPTFNRDGNWCLKKPLQLLLRPGGHGVIWKLAKEKGVFDWLEEVGASHALVRQINNPMAGVDGSLLAFLGIGYRDNRAFGFAACPRVVHAQEGVNVLKMMVKEGQKRLALTNVEYCQFKQFGLEDEPEKEICSTFPSNTNILFANLKQVSLAVDKLPYPGLLVNFRKNLCFDPKEGEKEESVARLESTMQNIADVLDIPYKEGQDMTSLASKLSTYVTFQERRKTISTTKRRGATHSSLLETPAGCCYDVMVNAHELLTAYCHMKVPPLIDEHTFLDCGPSFLLNYHPALGPLYSIIGQKIQGGKIAKGSELELQIADLECVNLDLDGSLIIQGNAILGETDHQGLLHYSHCTAQCSLKNVRIVNQGVDWTHPFVWKHGIKREESLKIILHKHSRFEASGVVFKGGREIVVPAGRHLVARQQGTKVIIESFPLSDQVPFWKYCIEEDHSISLHRG